MAEEYEIEEEETSAELDRPVPGADATLENMGASRPMPLADDSDVVAGTSSGMNLHKRPRRGDPLRGE